MRRYTNQHQSTFGGIVDIFLSSYFHKSPQISEEDWLYSMLREHIPDMSKKDIYLFCDEAAGRCKEVYSLLKETEASRNNYGWNAEMWLYHNIMKEKLNSDDLINLERANNVLELLGKWQQGTVYRGDNHYFDEDYWNGVHLPDLKSSLRAKQRCNDLYCVDINDLAIRFSRNASVNGIGSISIIGNITISKRSEHGVRNISQEEIMEILKHKGADIGFKNALAGALKVGAERNLIPVLGKAVSATTLETVAYFAVENSKVFWQFANHEISVLDAVDRASRISVSCIFSAKGMAVGAVLGTTIPVVGPIVGGMVGKMIGDVVAQKGSAIFYDATTHLAWCAADIALSEWSVLENMGKLVSKPLIRKKRAIEEMMQSFFV